VSELRWFGVDRLGPDERQVWAAGRVWAARQAPYLASALLALEPIVVEADGWFAPDLSAFPTDLAWHVYLDAAVLRETPVPLLGFWLVHQVTHLLRDHAGRAPIPVGDGAARLHPTREQRWWNTAGDAEINDDLTAGHIEIPEDAVLPRHIACEDGWLAEQYWDAIADTSTAPTTRDCGSGSDGITRPWDTGRPGLSRVGARLVGREVARRIREHVRQRGDVAGGWVRWADEVLEPAVRWERLLASAVRRGVADVAGRVDFTYRRPSRRAAATPEVILPALRQPVPKVAMVIDTSGSMSDSMLGQALAEVGGVLRSLGIGRRQLSVLCCDAEVTQVQRVLDARAVQLVGGGGTDMGAGLAAAEALRPRPDLVVVLTDGFTPWPPAAPRGIRVVVGLLDRAGHTPDWATTVVIESVAPVVSP
jgi:predicted metal-dependent peptidase